MAARSYLFAISLGVHTVLGAALALVPARTRREVIAISMSETKKPKAVEHVDPPPPPPDPPKAAAQPQRAKTVTPPPKAAEVAPESTAAPGSGDAVPDFGLSLSNAGGGGLAVPAGGNRGAAPPPTAAATKTLARAAHAPADDCDEPPGKPKPLARPTPAYTVQARAAGVSGKVRVEITVDAAGHVVSVRVLQGLGYGLDEAAMAAARAMTFEPALRCGKPSSSTFRVGFNFSPGTP